MVRLAPAIGTKDVTCAARNLPPRTSCGFTCCLTKKEDMTWIAVTTAAAIRHAPSEKVGNRRLTSPSTTRKSRSYDSILLNQVISKQLL